MSELYDQIVATKGSFERLVGRIPGFRGYLDNKARREADRLLRDHIADLLSQKINRFVEVENQLLDSGGLAYMAKTASAKSRLQLYRDRVKAAAPGYSGFFEAVKVTPEKLEALYSFDEAQIRYVDQIDEAVKKLAEAASAKVGVEEAIAAIDRLAVEAGEAFSLREDVLTGLNKTLGEA